MITRLELPSNCIGSEMDDKPSLHHVVYEILARLIEPAAESHFDCQIWDVIYRSIHYRIKFKAGITLAGGYGFALNPSFEWQSIATYRVKRSWLL